jgi:hypothetical protein
LPEGKEERRELFLGQSERQFSVVKEGIFLFLASKKGGIFFPKNARVGKKTLSVFFSTKGASRLFQAPRRG